MAPAIRLARALGVVEHGPRAVDRQRARAGIASLRDASETTDVSRSKASGARAGAQPDKALELTAPQPCGRPDPFGRPDPASRDSSKRRPD